jgi:bacteriocin-like protein
MENFDELDIEELTDDELDLVSGGWVTQLIHMDYYNLNNFDDPTAVRYA